jgi:pectinesterase
MNIITKAFQRLGFFAVAVVLATSLNNGSADEPKSAKAVASFDAVVSAAGLGTHKTIQDAIASAPENGTAPFRIRVKPGTYMGPFMVAKSKPNVQLIGDEIDKTILTWPWNVNEPQTEKPYQFNPGLVVVGNDFYAENLTIENTSGDHGQALAVRVDSDRSVFNHCRLLGWQDTLMANNGRHYFTNCFISGRVDFIYGSGTAVFDHCEIQSKNGGYITAANTPQDQPFGFVFLDCKLTGDPTPWKPTPGKTQFEAADVKTYLGRPWRPYGSVAFINCEMGSHIKPVGWHNWGKVENETTARYSEYRSTGPGANPAARVKWAKQLSDEEAKVYTLENILKGTDLWQPRHIAMGSNRPSHP